MSSLSRGCGVLQDTHLPSLHEPGYSNVSLRRWHQVDAAAGMPSVSVNYWFRNAYTYPDQESDEMLKLNYDLYLEQRAVIPWTQLWRQCRLFDNADRVEKNPAVGYSPGGSGGPWADRAAARGAWRAVDAGGARRLRPQPSGGRRHRGRGGVGGRAGRRLRELATGGRGGGTCAAGGKRRRRDGQLPAWSLFQVHVSFHPEAFFQASEDAQPRQVKTQELPVLVAKKFVESYGRGRALWLDGKAEEAKRFLRQAVDAVEKDFHSRWLFAQVTCRAAGAK